MDVNCKWRFRATKLLDLTYFEVRKFNNEHSCSLDAIPRDHRQASNSLIGQYVSQSLRGGSAVYIYQEISLMMCVCSLELIWDMIKLGGREKQQ